MSNLPFSLPHAHELAIQGEPIQGVESLSVLDGKKYVREREGNFTDSRLKSKLGSMAVNHLALLPLEVSGIETSADGTRDDIHLTIIPGLELGRQKSRSVVKFGQLYIDNNLDKPITEIVAVKYVHPIPAIREMNASLAVDRRFNQRLTYDPLGFIKHPDGKVGYITRYEHDVVSLDNILWNDQSTPEQRDQAMARAAIWMAKLHSVGIIHGDAQAKNIALDSAQLPHYIDLEGATDVEYGALDSTTKRLLDIGNLFDPDSMKLGVSDDEIMHFTDNYMDSQYGPLPPLEVEDILDTIASMEEQRKRSKTTKKIAG